MDTIFVKQVKEGGPASEAGLCTGPSHQCLVHSFHFSLHIFSCSFFPFSSLLCTSPPHSPHFFFCCCCWDWVLSFLKLSGCSWTDRRMKLDKIWALLVKTQTCSLFAICSWSLTKGSLSLEVPDQAGNLQNDGASLSIASSFISKYQWEWSTEGDLMAAWYYIFLI